MLIKDLLFCLVSSLFVNAYITRGGGLIVGDMTSVIQWSSQVKTYLLAIILMASSTSATSSRGSTGPKFSLNYD